MKEATELFVHFVAGETGFNIRSTVGRIQPLYGIFRRERLATLIARVTVLTDLNSTQAELPPGLHPTNPAY